MKQIKSKTFKAEIFMAGDYSEARKILREYCLRGACVSIEKVDYIYSLGEESGFVARLINYPRFKKDNSEIKANAITLAMNLIVGLQQGSCSIVYPDETIFMTRRGEDL